MSQRSGNPASNYSLSGEGVVWLAPRGTPVADILDDGAQVFVVSWTGRLNVTGQDVSDTRDYNATTRLMNPRDLNVSQRLTGNFDMFHDSEEDQDFLLLYPITSYPAARLYVTQGNVAVVGPPAIEASRAVYFNLTEIQMMTQDFGGGAVTEFRKLGTEFQSNGLFEYQNVAAA